MFEPTGCYQTGKVSKDPLWQNVLGKKAQVLFDGMNPADGSKIQKKTMEGTQEHITDYLSGFQYDNGKLSFFPTAEGYVKATELEGDQVAYNYVYPVK